MISQKSLLHGIPNITQDVPEDFFQSPHDVLTEAVQEAKAVGSVNEVWEPQTFGGVYDVARCTSPGNPFSSLENECKAKIPSLVKIAGEFLPSKTSLKSGKYRLNRVTHKRTG